MGKGLRGLLWATLALGLLAFLFGLVAMFTPRSPSELRAAGGWCAFLGPLLFLGAAGGALTIRARLLAEHRVALLQVLAAAVRRGRPPAQALSALADDYPPALRRRTWRILNEIDRGLPLSGALALGAPGLLSPGEMGALRAAEGGPRLGAVLDGLVLREARRRTSTDGLPRRLLYPAVVFGLGALVALLLVGGWRDRVLPPLPADAPPPSPAAVAAGETLGRAEAAGIPAALLSALAVSGLLGLLLLEGSRGRIPPLRWFAERAATRGGGGLLALDRAELVCRGAAAAAAAGLPLDRALERVADAGGGGRGAEALRAAAGAVRRGEPPARALGEARLPAWVALRLAAAAGGPPERLGEEAEALADECGRLRAARASLLAAAVAPATLLLGGALAAFLLHSVLVAWNGVALDLGGVR